MPVQGLFGQTIELLSKEIDLRARNHNHIAANLANVETPGYTPTRLSFEQQLKEALSARPPHSSGVTHERHIPLKGKPHDLGAVQGTVVDSSASTVGRDGNRVDVEREMAALAENQIMYNASVQLLAKKFEGLKQAIKGSAN